MEENSEDVFPRNMTRNLYKISGFLWYEKYSFIWFKFNKP